MQKILLILLAQRNFFMIIWHCLSQLKNIDLSWSSWLQQCQIIMKKKKFCSCISENDSEITCTSYMYKINICKFSCLINHLYPQGHVNCWNVEKKNADVSSKGPSSKWNVKLWHISPCWRAFAQKVRPSTPKFQQLYNPFGLSYIIQHFQGNNLHLYHCLV